MRFNAPDIRHVRFSDLTGIRTSAVICTWLSETGTPKAKSTSAGSVSVPWTSWTQSLLGLGLMVLSFGGDVRFSDLNKYCTYKYI